MYRKSAHTKRYYEDSNKKKGTVGSSGSSRTWVGRRSSFVIMGRGRRQNERSRPRVEVFVEVVHDVQGLHLVNRVGVGLGVGCGGGRA